MLHEIARRVRHGDSFAFETTLSGRHYARLIPVWRAAGYHVKLLFLALPTSALAVARVTARVAQGGHKVPTPIIIRRFESGLRNFHELYKQKVNSWALYDNAGTSPTLTASGDNP